MVEVSEDEPLEAIPGYIDTEMAASLGRAVVEWAYIEASVDKLIWEMVRLEREVGACLTMQLTSVARRFDVVISLAELFGISDENIKKLRHQKDKARSLSEKRNRIAHDTWLRGMDSKNNYRSEILKKPNIHFKYIVVSKDDIENIIVEFRNFKRSFEALSSRINAELYSTTTRPLPPH